MIYLKNFDSHASYEEKLNGGGVDISLPNVSYCEDVKDIHYTPYNLVRFYVGDITGTTPQTVKIYTDYTNHEDVTVSKDNKWYTYLLPKDKGLHWIIGDSVKKVVVKADISFEGNPFDSPASIIPNSTIEVSFKGSNTSKVTNMYGMFGFCSGLTSLDISNFDTSNVTNMNSMFINCTGLTSLDVSNFDTSKVTDMNSMFSDCKKLNAIRMVGCTTETITKIEEALTDAGIKDKVEIKTT